MSSDKLDSVYNTIKLYFNYPEHGLLYRDVFPILANPEVFANLNELILEAARSLPHVEAVVGLESKGFLFGPTLAQSLRVPFVPLRKAGKLPGEIVSHSYVSDGITKTFEIQKDVVKKHQRLLVIDDIIFSGATLNGACALLEKVEAQVVYCLCIIEILDQKGRENLGWPLKTLMSLKHGELK